jgi:hypothetical protein
MCSWSTEYSSLLDSSALAWERFGLVAGARPMSNQGVGRRARVLIPRARYVWR